MQPKINLNLVKSGLIASVFLGVIGVTYSLFHVQPRVQPKAQPVPEVSAEVPAIAEIIPVAPGNNFAGVVPLHAPIMALEPQIKALMAKYNFLETGMFFLDLQTGDYLDIGGDRVFPAASTIKLPIMVAFFQDVDAGKVKLDEMLTMRKDLITDGSGVMQYQPVDKQYTALETATKMMTISDNTATNMIIDRLGGMEALNERFRSWGLKDTVINNLLSDLKGTNTTSSHDQARILAMLVNDKLVSTISRDQALNILRRTTVRTLLRGGVGKDADVANKTGDIGFIIGDAGVIKTKNGRRYLATIFVKRAYNDRRGSQFVREVSKIVYNYQNQQLVGTKEQADRGQEKI